MILKVNGNYNSNNKDYDDNDDDTITIPKVIDKKTIIITC